ncbi:MAG: hypothetical protein LBC51_11735 [Treponema sp.]|jgi:hypothetical protein|nr:hypothetical protein [Treponema sp.]
MANRIDRIPPKEEQLVALIAVRQKRLPDPALQAAYARAAGSRRLFTPAVYDAPPRLNRGGGLLARTRLHCYDVPIRGKNGKE